MTTIATTTAIAMPMARQLVSRSSAVGFGWMNPPMVGLYYSVYFHHRDTEKNRRTGVWILAAAIDSKNLLRTHTPARTRFLAALGMTILKVFGKPGTRIPKPKKE